MRGCGKRPVDITQVRFRQLDAETSGILLHVGDAVAVTVYDAAGNVVAQGDGTDAVSAAALPSGVYVARAGDTVVKFVK